MKFGIDGQRRARTRTRLRDQRYQFCRAALAAGHEIQRVFFYHDGVNNATRLTEPPQDDRHIVNRWSKLAAEHKVDLVVCVAAALRRGIKDEILAHGLSHFRPGPAGRIQYPGRPPGDLRRLIDARGQARWREGDRSRSSCS